MYLVCTIDISFSGDSLRLTEFFKSIWNLSSFDVTFIFTGFSREDYEKISEREAVVVELVALTDTIIFEMFVKS